jgi:signal transduction histidine kinase
MLGAIRRQAAQVAAYARARGGLAALLVGAVSAVALLALQSYRLIDRELTEAALSRRASLSYLTAAVLSEKFGRLVDIGVSLATRVRFRELVAEGKWREASRLLRSIPGDFPFIDRITLNDIHGTLRADIPEAPEVRGWNFADRDWYRGVTRAWQPYVSEVYRRAAVPQMNVFVAAIPIRSDKGDALGILVLQVRSDAFFDWTRGIEVGAGGLVYIVDQKGMLASHPKFPPQGDLADFSMVPVVQRVLGGAAGVDIEFNPSENQDRVVAYAPIAKHGWGVVLEQPAEAAFATRDHQLRRILIAYALILASLASVALLVSLIVIQRRQARTDRLAKAELEQRVAERTAQLESSNRELEGFSYSVSHDLRAPLRAINGFAEMVQEGYGERLDDEGRRKLRVIRDNSEKMGQLIDDLLAFSRLGRQAISAGQADMAAVAREVFEELRVASAANPARLTIEPMPSAWCDPALIRQVWINVLANAIKFSAVREEPLIEAGGYADGAHDVYYVKDNGVGFDMRYREKLFGVFERLHSAKEFPGTGVGLAIVKRVVERHGGRVWAEGRVDAGATFYFALPRASSPGMGEGS